MEKNLGGVELAWEEAGTGLPVVLLHAFPLHRRMWAAQVDELAGRYRLIAPDLRGFGESGVPDEDSTMERMADDLRALLDELGLARVVLGGLSMGGYVALAFLRRWPARILALILADTRAAPDTEEGRRGRHEMAELAEREGAAAVAERMLPRLLAAATLERRPQLVEAVRAMILSNSPAGLARAQRGMAARADSRPLLATLRCPTLVVAGEHDAFTPPAEMEAMAQAIPGATFVRIPEAAHLSNLEQPVPFNAALHDFLARAPAP